MSRSRVASTSETRFPYSSTPILVALSSIVLLTFCTGVRAESRASGTYVASDASSAASLQLTQTANGQIVGALSVLSLKEDGAIETVQKSLSGAVDNGEITLTIRGEFFGLDSITLAGSFRGDSIGLQSVASNGAVQSWIFHRASASQFQELADGIRAKSNSILTDAAVAKFVGSVQQTMQTAVAWVADADLHVKRIPGVKERYREIEENMQTLIRKETASPRAATRGQISVAVSQDDVAGSQVDVGSSQVWQQVLTGGRSLSSNIGTLLRDCSQERASELGKRGASQSALESWRDACGHISAARGTLDPLIRSIEDKHAELISFQREAEKRRRALVAQADRLE